MLLKKNQTIAYYGGAKNLGIIDKDDEVLESQGILILENQNDEKQEKIKVGFNLNYDCEEVDIDKIISLMPPEQNNVDEINKKLENLLLKESESYCKYYKNIKQTFLKKTKQENKPSIMKCYTYDLCKTLGDFFGSGFCVTLPRHIDGHYLLYSNILNNKALHLEVKYEGNRFDYYDALADLKNGDSTKFTNGVLYNWKPLPMNIEEIADIINEQSGQIDWRRWICQR